MMNKLRFVAAFKASSLHLLSCLFVALLAALLVFGLWYPHPYRELSGGRELFLLIIVVDVVCGPLLTLVLFSPTKPKIELWRDLSFVVLIQVAALVYGIYTVWQVRPLFLAMDSDRFKVVVAADLDAVDVSKLPDELQPKLWGGPITVGLRAPRDVEEKNKVLFSALQGGRDYAERPEFFVSYQGDVALKSLKSSKTIELFLKKYANQRAIAEDIAKERGVKLADLRLLPVVGRQDWVALLDQRGQIQGFLKGDGFE